MARTSIGLDVGTRAVRIAEVRFSGGKPSLMRFGRVLLPAGAVEQGEVQDPEAVASAIGGLWKRLGLKGRAVHVGVANRHVVVRVLELPAMPAEDLEPAIRFQAQEQIPIPLDDAVMDYEVLETFEGAEGQQLQRVLVVAAERTTIDALLRALQAARLEPQTLELNAYPLVRCFDGNESSNAQAIVDIGAGVTNVVVHQGGKIRFTRILPTFGGEEFTATVAEGLDVPREQAETLKRDASFVLRDRANLPFAVVASSATGEPSSAMPGAIDFLDADAEPVSEAPSSPTDAVADLLEQHLDRFINEVRGSIDFYTSQPDALPLERVVVTGGGSLLGGLTDRLASSLGVPVELGRPFAHVPVSEAEVTARELSRAEPFLGVAVGLALAENGG